MNEIRAQIKDIRVNTMYYFDEILIDVPKGNHSALFAFAEKVRAGAGKMARIRIDYPARKRSLTANGYYWHLVDEIAKAVKTSTAEVHNTLLSRYGAPQRDKDGKIAYVLIKDGDSYRKDETLHLKPTDSTEDRKGTLYRWFILLKGSSKYDSREMARLIDGAISEAKDLDIDTLSVNELKELEGYE